MLRLLRARLLSARFLTLGVMFLVGLMAWAAWAKGEPAATIPGPVLAKLHDEDAKFIQKALAKAPLKDKNARKVKAAALLIATYAQLSPDKGPNPPFVRDTALKLIAAIDGGNVKAQKDLAGLLTSKGKASSAEPGPVPLQKHLKLEYVMRVFSSVQVGGFGLEKDLETLGDTKGELTGAEKDKALNLAYKTAALIHLAHSYVPEQDEGMKTRKNWLAFSGNTHKAVLDLAEAVNTGKSISAASDKLAGTCVKCHDVFR